MNNQQIGSSIMLLRKQHGLSQRELAEKAGIAHSAISSIENGKVSPSVSSLHKIVSVFSMSLSNFFMLENSKKDKLVIRKDELVEIGNELVSMKLVTNHDEAQKIGFLIEEYSPYSTTGQNEILHDGEEVGIVLEGEITLIYEDESYIIKKDESYIIKTTKPHKFVNHTGEICRLITAHTPLAF